MLIGIDVPGLAANDLRGARDALDARLARLGWRRAELHPLHDIDELRDLAHVPGSWLSWAGRQ